MGTFVKVQPVSPLCSEGIGSAPHSCLLVKVREHDGVDGHQHHLHCHHHHHPSPSSPFLPYDYCHCHPHPHCHRDCDDCQEAWAQCWRDLVTRLCLPPDRPGLVSWDLFICPFIGNSSFRSHMSRYIFIIGHFLLVRRAEILQRWVHHPDPRIDPGRGGGRHPDGGHT